MKSADAIVRAARLVNEEIQVPEVLILGYSGAGKSSLIEALLGHAVLPVGKIRIYFLFLKKKTIFLQSCFLFALP